MRRIDKSSSAAYQPRICAFWAPHECAIFLENSTTKTSWNSSKPSSQTEKDETSLDHPGSKGKGKAERRQSAYNSRSIETTTVATVSAGLPDGRSESPGDVAIILPGEKRKMQ